MEDLDAHLGVDFVDAIDYFVSGGYGCRMVDGPGVMKLDFGAGLRLAGLLLCTLASGLCDPRGRVLVLTSCPRLCAGLHQAPT